MSTSGGLFHSEHTLYVLHIEELGRSAVFILTGVSQVLLFLLLDHEIAEVLIAALEDLLLLLLDELQKLSLLSLRVLYLRVKPLNSLRDLVQIHCDVVRSSHISLQIGNQVHIPCNLPCFFRLMPE